MTTEQATFAAGCFWGVEKAFAETPGVLDTKVGYTGGDRVDPTYEQVCTGRTGHAEAVQLRFDPSVVTYEQLLALFFRLHDPTQLNRQGPDTGTQYRSAIFFHTPEQKELAEKAITDLMAAKRFSSPIVTQVAPEAIFYPAEDYHQRYWESHPLYCH